MSTPTSLRPPKDKQKEHNHWWLCYVDSDGRRERPEVWEWSPGRLQWFRSGDMCTNGKGVAPCDMSRFILIGLVRIPDSWPSCDDIGDRG